MKLRLFSTNVVFPTPGNPINSNHIKFTSQFVSLCLFEDIIFYSHFTSIFPYVKGKTVPRSVVFRDDRTVTEWAIKTKFIKPIIKKTFSKAMPKCLSKRKANAFHEGSHSVSHPIWTDITGFISGNIMPNSSQFLSINVLM